MVGRIIDVSSNNHPNGAINWPAVARAGVTTAIIKATEGTTYVNPYYQSDRSAALAAGMDVLAYHYAGFGSAVGEARTFIQYAGSRYARILDAEQSTNVAWMRSFLMELGNPSAELCTYGSQDPIGSIRGQIPSTIWVAAYGQNYPGYGVMWQFTDKAEIPGISGPCDESSWHGTDLQYETLFGLDNPPDPTPGPEEATDVTSWQAGGQNHIAGVVNGVAYHWWQEIGGNPTGPKWSVEQLPT
jgi:lysozyme